VFLEEDTAVLGVFCGREWILHLANHLERAAQNPSGDTLSKKSGTSEQNELSA
jgi:hypothetical protein